MARQEFWGELFTLQQGTKLYLMLDNLFSCLTDRLNLEFQKTILKNFIYSKEFLFLEDI